MQPAALAPYRTAADQDTIDNAQAADIAAINEKIPSTASKNNKLVAWSTFNGLLGTKQDKITANGILKGDGAGGVSAAVAGTDYLAPPALDAYRTAAAQDEIDAAQDEDIADVKAAVDQKAPIIINSASGDIAHFEDGADNMPIKQLTVNVEPIQDLHGYDSPWPAGAGGISLTWLRRRITSGLTTPQAKLKASADFGLLGLSLLNPGTLSEAHPREARETLGTTQTKVRQRILRSTERAVQRRRAMVLSF